MRALLHKFRQSAESKRTLRRLVKLGYSQVHQVFRGASGEGPGDSISYDQWLYRSIVYTLFYANVHSAHWIIEFDNKMPVHLPYNDVKLVLRAMLERLIHQEFIMTDPLRLAKMFALWQTIEFRRFYKSLEAINLTQPESIAARLYSGRNHVEPLSPEQEAEYEAAVQEWENLVIPKQKAASARNWSGLSLSEMADRSGLHDFYKLTYKSMSWYAHSLIDVSDYYLQQDLKEPGGWVYSAKPTEEQKRQCCMEATILLGLSFKLADSTLQWGADDKISEILSKEPSIFKLLVYELTHEWLL